MILHIPFIEASELIEAKIRQKVTFCHANENTIHAEVAVKKLFFSANIGVSVMIVKFENEKLKLSLSFDSKGMDLMLKGALMALPSISNQELIEWNGDTKLTVNLSKIEQVHKALQQVDVETIKVCVDGFDVTFTLKK